MNFERPVDDLAYLHQQPQLKADFRTHSSDFIVQEQLGFELSGSGEHLCLWIEKQGENTIYVAKQLAKLAGVKVRDVSYCGLKDRHGITRQWFSVPVPIKSSLDWSALQSDKIKVLDQARHSKKLRSGCHKANGFEIVLRQVSDMAELEQRLALVQRLGVPNYFGSQRFGHYGNNLALAQRMFDGEKIRDRKLKGLVISAARSLLFNQLVSKRIEQDCFYQPLEGDLFRLSGTRSYFCEPVTEQILQRLQQDDIQIALPLVGDDKKTQSISDAQDLATQVYAPYKTWVDGLQALGLQADSRPLGLKATDWQIEKLGPQQLKLSFTLPVGCYATAILRELAQLTDVTNQQILTSGGK